MFAVDASGRPAVVSGSPSRRLASCIRTFDATEMRRLSLSDNGRASCSSIRDWGTFPLLVDWPRAAARAAERVAISRLYYTQYNYGWSFASRGGTIGSSFSESSFWTSRSQLHRPKHNEILTHLDLNITRSVDPTAAAQMVIKLL